ncbi:Protoporphyrinogen oxidase [Xylaria sp. CBS 124048]|nr:Protoporphyrinogen oxidase [Xylaria sp. CBS 124048]
MISQCSGHVFIGLLRSVYNNVCHSGVRLTARRPALLSRHCSRARTLSTLLHSADGLPSIRQIRHRALGTSSSYATSKSRRQSYSKLRTPDDDKQRQIAVIGGGITGLTAAHYLARYAKNAKITIYEASDRPGGWVKGDRVVVEDELGQQGHVLFQHGPRVLRSGNMTSKYDDLVLYDVISTLRLDRKMRQPRHVSGKRFLYYPDHLVKMPSRDLSVGNIVDAARSFLTEPLWSGLLPSAFNAWVSLNKSKAPLVLNNSPDGVAAEAEPTGFLTGRGPDWRNVFNNVPDDESIAQFLTRILGDDRIVNNVISGLMHGIYGGDVHKLSAKHTILEQLWYQFKSPLPGNSHVWVNSKERHLVYDMLSAPQRLDIIELAENAVDWQLMAFQDGLLSLVDALVKDLKSRDVTFEYLAPVTSLKHENGKVLVTTPKDTDPVKYDHVICTLFSKKLAQITEPPNALPSLAETHAVTIMVVNLWYPDPNLLKEGGFGYLIPSSTPNNDECALGVLFDSDLRTDNLNSDDYSETPGTKLTVMLGGHYWDGWEHLPSEEMGIAMAKEVVQRHLGISVDEKVVTAAHLCKDCLPQHFVGHRKRMEKAHYELMSAFQGHLSVAGPSYTTIGVIPAMRAGRDAAMRVARGHGQPWFRVGRDNDPSWQEYDYWQVVEGKHGEEVLDVIGETGLEQFTEDEWEQLEAHVRSGLPFRGFTDPDIRFTDEDGILLREKWRDLKNAPPAIKLTPDPSDRPKPSPEDE